MKATMVIMFLYTAALIVVAEEAATKDLAMVSKDLDIDDNDEGDDLGRRHKKKRKKHQQNSSPCGYGRSFFGDKFGQPDYTYVNAPVMNYFFGCGGPVVPQYAPVQAFPVYQIPLQQGHGHGGHGHGGHGHGHGSHGSHGGHGQNQFGYNPFQQGYQPYQQQGYQQQGYQQQGYQQPNQGFQSGYNQRPFQGAVSAAASGFGTALADYLTKPRKAQRQINQLLRPIYKLF